MRVSMSAIGSVMLMGHLTLTCFAPRSSATCLPARLDHTRDLATHCVLTQLVASEAELAEHAARTSRQAAAVAQPYRTCIARKLLQLEPGGHAVFVRVLGVADGSHQLGTLLRELLHR